MTRIQIISLVLTVVLAVTAINLFYDVSPARKFRTAVLKILFSRTPIATDRNEAFVVVDPLDSQQCPLRGLRCPQPKRCDCAELCPKNEFVKFVVERGDAIVVLDRKLEPGAYCLPEGFDACNRNADEMPVYTLTGWTCSSTASYRAGRAVACKSEYARDDDLNFVEDGLYKKALEDDAADLYETLPDGSMRYRCACGSLDLFGNRMVRSLPFVCSVDYCIRDVPDAPPGLGWDPVRKRCECGPYPRAETNDPTSPCVGSETTRYRGGILVGRVDCTTRKSLERKAFYCPEGAPGSLSFETRMTVGVGGVREMILGTP